MVYLRPENQEKIIVMNEKNLNKREILYSQEKVRAV